MLPELDGFQATELIREHELPLKKHTPIIAITAAAMKDDQERCMQSGMDDYLSKPFDSERLYEKIEQWLSYRLRNQKKIQNQRSR
jgi:CheY-like chemotaxis protein